MYYLCPDTEFRNVPKSEIIYNMKSKIRIDLDVDNNPVITVKYEDSDDLKDLAVKNLLKDLRENGKILICNFQDESLFNLEPNVAILRPVHTSIELENAKSLLEHKNFCLFVENVSSIIEEYKKEVGDTPGKIYTWRTSSSFGICDGEDLYPKLKDFSYKKLSDYVYELLSLLTE